MILLLRCAECIALLMLCTGLLMRFAGKYVCCLLIIGIIDLFCKLVELLAESGSAQSFGGIYLLLDL